MIFSAGVLQPVSEFWVLLASLMPLLHVVRPSSCACSFLGYFLHLLLSPFSHTSSNMCSSSGCFFFFFLIKFPGKLWFLQITQWLLFSPHIQYNLSAIKLFLKILIYHSCLQVQVEHKHCSALCHPIRLHYNTWSAGVFLYCWAMFSKHSGLKLFHILVLCINHLKTLPRSLYVISYM